MNPEILRRKFLYHSLTGAGGIALMDLLSRDVSFRQSCVEKIIYRWVGL